MECWTDLGIWIVGWNRDQGKGILSGQLEVDTWIKFSFTVKYAGYLKFIVAKLVLHEDGQEKSENLQPSVCFSCHSVFAKFALNSYFYGSV